MKRLSAGKAVSRYSAKYIDAEYTIVDDVLEDYDGPKDNYADIILFREIIIFVLGIIAGFLLGR